MPDVEVLAPEAKINVVNYHVRRRFHGLRDLRWSLENTMRCTAGHDDIERGIQIAHTCFSLPQYHFPPCRILLLRLGRAWETFQFALQLSGLRKGMTFNTHGWRNSS